MSAQDQFFADLEPENRQAALLVVQVGGMPQELQIITQVADYDESAGGLRPVRSYIVRVLGALEHHVVNFGMTVDEVRLVSEHPLLYQYNKKPTAVFCRGEVENVDEVVLDLAQAHASVFKRWRHFPEYFNPEQSLHSILSAGGGLVGQMPAPLAESVVKVLEHHGFETRTAEGEAYTERNDHKQLQPQPLSVLTFGASYFVSYAFSFDVMRGKQKEVE